MSRLSMELDDAVVEALYEYGYTTMNEVLRHVRRRLGRIDERYVRQSFQELQSKQELLTGV